MSFLHGLLFLAAVLTLASAAVFLFALSPYLLLGLPMPSWR